MNQVRLLKTNKQAVRLFLIWEIYTVSSLSFPTEGLEFIYTGRNIHHLDENNLHCFLLQSVTCWWKLKSLFRTGGGHITTQKMVHQRKGMEEMTSQNIFLFHPNKPPGGVQAVSVDGLDEQWCPWPQLKWKHYFSCLITVKLGHNMLLHMFNFDTFWWNTIETKTFFTF